MNAERTLGPTRLVNAIREFSTGPLRGVALFFTAGTVSATVIAENPMLSGRRQLADVAVRAAKSGLPQAVGLAVAADGVDVYPMTLTGRATGEPLTRWNRGEFSATTFRGILVVRLVVVLPTGQRIQLETKTFPVGVNRHNARVARMIVHLAKGPSAADPS